MIRPPVPPIAPASYLADGYEMLLGDSLILGGYPLPPYVKFPAGTKVILRQSKIISVTNVNGLSGTIKEVSGMGDWQISIEAQLVALTYSALFTSAIGADSLLTQLKDIRALWLKMERLEITNERLEAMGITHIVLKDFNLPDNVTYYDQQVRLEALSDHEYDLALERPEGSAG